MYITFHYNDIDRTGRRLSVDGGGCVKFDLSSFDFKRKTKKLVNEMHYNDVRYVLLMLVDAAANGYNAYYTVWDPINSEYFNCKVSGKTAVNDFIDHCTHSIPGVITPEYLNNLTKKIRKGVFNYV